MLIQWSGQCGRLCCVLTLLLGSCFKLFRSPSSSIRVQVPCLPWLLLVGTACLSMLGWHVSLCFLGHASDRFMPCTCWHVEPLTLCVAGLLLL
jgi:hypothetical protein